jgi:hypothetical protein
MKDLNLDRGIIITEDTEAVEKIDGNRFFSYLCGNGF